MLKNEKDNGSRWSEINDKDEVVYVPLLHAFMDEVNRAYKEDKNMPRKMIEYLIGIEDYYKVVSRDSKRLTMIHTFNMHDTLNKPSENKVSAITVPVVCMEPARGLNTQSAYEKRRFEINRVLMLKGIEIRDDGNFYKITKAESLSEVERRTRELKNKLSCYGAHQRVLICCREELLVDDYFHAVQEAEKGICDRVREMSGLLTDGNELIQTAFSVKNPYIVLNSLGTTSEQN